jgi:uncharacterized coiled-coil protein SlyX
MDKELEELVHKVEEIALTMEPVVDKLNELIDKSEEFFKTIPREQCRAFEAKNMKSEIIDRVQAKLDKLADKF